MYWTSTHVWDHPCCWTLPQRDKDLRNGGLWGRTFWKRAEGRSGKSVEGMDDPKWGRAVRDGVSPSRDG